MFEPAWFDLVSFQHVQMRMPLLFQHAVRVGNLPRFARLDLRSLRTMHHDSVIKSSG